MLRQAQQERCWAEGKFLLASRCFEVKSRRMAPSIKICGINTAAALDAALTVRADHVGLVFFAPSPRDVSPIDAARLGARAAGRIGLVGLSVSYTHLTLPTKRIV